MADPSPTAAPASRIGWAALLRVVGGVLALVALGLCVRAVWNDWDQISDALRHADWRWVAAGLLASFASMSGLAVLWWSSLRLFGERVTIRQALAWYFVGELGKYLPGGVWAVLGRGEMAQRHGNVSRGTAYATTLISYGVMCISAASVCGLALPFVPRGSSGGVGWFAATVLLIPIGIAVVHPAVFGRILALGRRATRGKLDMTAPGWGQMVRLILVGMPTWVFLGLASWLVAQGLGFHTNVFQIVFASVAAWIIGFLAIPVPAGAGFREGIFVLLCGLGHGPGAAVALIARVLLLVVDAVGGALGLARSAHGSRRP